MKLNHLLLTLLAAAPAATHSFAAECSCQKAKQACQCRSEAKCDDRGLLDVVDYAARSLHASVEGSVSKIMPNLRMPTLDLGIRKSGESHNSCDSSSCDARGGMECNCGHSNEAAGQHGAPNTTHSEMPFYEGEFHQHLVPQPETVPGPLPLRDAEVDPFIDDSASRSSPTPARTIQYQRRISSYGEEFTPQAKRLSHADYWAGSVAERRPNFEGVSIASAEAAVQRLSDSTAGMSMNLVGQPNRVPQVAPKRLPPQGAAAERVADVAYPNPLRK